MSGFDDNSPFGDPFADPSITQVTGNRKPAEGSLDDYNPFANQGTKTSATPAQVRGASNPPLNSEPAVLETATANGSGAGRQPTVYAPAAAQAAKLTQEELLRRQEELDRRAAELAARERALSTGSAAAGVVRQPNWPPIPAFCPFGPCLYQDINVEIPVEFQKIVRYAYYLWMYFVVVLLLNMIGGIAKWPLYKAFKTDSSINFMVFFFIFFVKLVFSVVWAIGIPGSGACGLIVAIDSLRGEIKFHVLYSMLMFLTAIAFISYSGLSFLVMMKVHSIYRSTGASFDKAKSEFTAGVMSNQHVQQAAAGAARSAMTGAFQAATNNQTTTGVRY